LPDAADAVYVYVTPGATSGDQQQIPERDAVETKKYPDAMASGLHLRTRTRTHMYSLSAHHLLHHSDPTALIAAISPASSPTSVIGNIAPDGMLVVVPQIDV